MRVTTMHAFRSLALSAALLFGASSCGAVLSALPTVIAAVTDGMQILDMIEQHADLVMAQANVGDVTKQRVHAALGKAKAALNAALRAAQGAEKVGHLDQTLADSAFADFRAAYLELLEVVRPLGVSEDSGTMRAAVSGTTLRVPRPEAFTLQVPRD